MSRHALIVVVLLAIILPSLASANDWDRDFAEAQRRVDERNERGDQQYGPQDENLREAYRLIHGEEPPPPGFSPKAQRDLMEANDWLK